MVVSRSVTLINRRALLTAAAVSVPAYARAQSHIPSASRLNLPGWHNRHMRILARVANQRFDLLLLGDSIMQELQRGSPDPRQNVVSVWDRYYAPRNALDLGFAGDACPNLLWRIQNGEVANQSPRLAIVLIGSNDAGPPWHWGPEQTVRGVLANVAAARAAMPNTPVLVLGLLPSQARDDDKIAINRLLTAQAWTPLAATFLDAGRVLRGQDGRIDPSLYLDPLLTPPHLALHPNAQGWALVAAAIEPTVARLFGDALR